MIPENKQIKQIETKQFTIELLQDENFRYVVKYKRKSMDESTSLNFQDLAFANKIFDETLITLEGH